MQNLSLILLLLLTFSCDSVEKEKESNDAGVDLKADVITDSGRTDTSPIPDMGADAKQDMAVEDMPKSDMGSGNKVMAILGERCEPKNRIAVVEVQRYQDLNVGAFLMDAKNPTTSDPISSDAACSFFDFVSDTPCAACETDEVCNAVGTCVPRPNIIVDGEINVSNGTDTKTITTQNGSLSDTVELSGESFSMVLTWPGYEVTLPSMKIPGALEGLTGNLDGGYDSPEALDFTWTTPEDPASVFTNIPMNHHVSRPAFTECFVDATVGKLHVDGEMLKPLAVSTGLEFQTLDHVRFAAAEVDLGCVEFRYKTANFPPF